MVGTILRIVFGTIGFALLGLYVWGLQVSPHKDKLYQVAEREISVEANEREVFDYVVDLENLRSYLPGLITIKANQEGTEVDVGHSYSATVDVFLLGQSQDVEMSIVDFQRPGYLRFKMDLPPLMPVYTMSFVQGVDGGTDISWTVESRNREVWFDDFVLPMTRLIWQYREDQMVDRFAEAFVERKPREELVEPSVADLMQ